MIIKNGINLTPRALEAVILDMDGVITQTAKIHREAWKEMFDRYLADCTEKNPPCLMRII